MNNTSFSRIRNVDNITDMGYSLNRVSPSLENNKLLRSPQILETQRQHPDKKWDRLINIPLFHKVLTHNMKEGHHRMTPTNQ